MEPQNNSQLSSQLSSNNLSAWIRLEEIKLSRNTKIPQRVRFYLNPDLLQDLSQFKNHRRSLSFSPTLLNQLRYYALLNSPLEQVNLINNNLAGKRCYWLQPGLTFDTDYIDDVNGRSRTLLRSAIDSEGKITQQIHQDLWHNSQLLEQLTAVHYWLIAEIMAQLPGKRNYLNTWLVFIILLVIVGIISLIINYYISLILVVNLAVIIIIAGVFKSQLKSSLIKWLKSKIIYHLVAGLLAKNKKISQVALKVIMLIP